MTEIINMKDVEGLVEIMNVYFDKKVRFEDVIRDQYQGVSILYSLRKNEMVYTIVSAHTDDFKSDSGGFDRILQDRLYSYLDLIGEESSNLNKLILQVLHEFGHVFYIDRMMEYDCLDANYFITNTIENFTEISFTDKDREEYKEDGVDIPYMFRGDEMYADYFAIKNFIPFKKYLDEYHPVI